MTTTPTDATGRNPPRATTAHAAFAALRLPRPIVTRHGPVVVGAVGLDDHGRCLTIRVETTSGDPHYRIFSPPLLAEDPAGPVAVDGRRYRLDPVTAVAEVIARHRAGRRGSR